MHEQSFKFTFYTLKRINHSKIKAFNQDWNTLDKSNLNRFLCLEGKTCFREMFNRALMKLYLKAPKFFKTQTEFKISIA